MNYYNEIDPFAAQWLRELIQQGHIADGIVDERSIEDVTPTDFLGFAQCHFFAGIGVWSYALRQAGWPDDRPIWTGSCPCQPFSSAGKGAGFADERHLWPAFHWLIRQCRPELVLGEQVANKAGESWFDLVRADLEAEGYAAGLAVFPACGVGAPHQRKRLYWVADSQGQRSGQGWQDTGRGVAGSDAREGAECVGGGTDGRLADSASQRRDGRQDTTGQSRGHGDQASGAACGMADTINCTEQRSESRPVVRQLPQGAGTVQTKPTTPGPVNGFWRAADWLFCRDGKWRPVEPGSFPLASRASARVGRLRGYGNSIVTYQAKAFIEAVEASR